VVSIQRLAEMRQFLAGDGPEGRRTILHRPPWRAWATPRSQELPPGFKAVADLVERLNAEESKHILEKPLRQAPAGAGPRHFANLMFTFEDLVTVPAASISRGSFPESTKPFPSPCHWAAARRPTTTLARHKYSRRWSSRAVDMLKGRHWKFLWGPGAFARGGRRPSRRFSPWRGSPRSRGQDHPEAGRRRRDARVDDTRPREKHVGQDAMRTHPKET